MKTLTLIAALSVSTQVFAGGFTDSDGSLTDYVNTSSRLNLDVADMFAACQVADLVTTKIAFGAGAVEGNPVMASVFAKLGWAGMIGVKLALIYGVYKLVQHYGESAKPVVAVGTVLTCGVAGHNLFVN